MGPTDPNPSNTPGGADPLGRLRSLRVRPDRARDLHADLAAHMKTIRKVSRAEGALARAWEAAAPDALSARCTLIGMRSGRVEIGVPDAATRYQADRWLRSGGLSELSALARVPIRGVRLRLMAPTRR